MSGNPPKAYAPADYAPIVALGVVQGDGSVLPVSASNTLPLGVADGANVAMGAKADAAYADATLAAAGSLVALLKGIFGKIASTLTVQSAYAAPASWSGGSFDGRAYSGIECQVIGAPSSAYTPQRSLDGATWVNTTVFDQNGASVTLITAAGLYSIKGRGYVRLNGGAGSTLYIAGEQ